MLFVCRSQAGNTSCKFGCPASLCRSQSPANGLSINSQTVLYNVSNSIILLCSLGDEHEVYGIGTDDIETTPNEVYGINTDIN